MFTKRTYLIAILTGFAFNGIHSLWHGISPHGIFGHITAGMLMAIIGIVSYIHLTEITIDELKDSSYGTIILIVACAHILAYGHKEVGFIGHTGKAIFVTLLGAFIVFLSAYLNKNIGPEPGDIRFTE